MAVSLLLCLLFLGVGADVPDFDWDNPTLLDEYVHRDDGYWSWDIVTSHQYQGVTVYIVNMTSQMWMAHDPGFSSNQLWWHIMGVAIPDDVTKPDWACLYIDAGSNTPDSYPPPENPSNLIIASFANDTGAVVSYMLQVPTQPQVFRDDPTQRVRREDDVIAYTWRWFIDQSYAGNDPAHEVIIRMPMTKAGKRGLDTVAAVAEEVAGLDIDKFAVAGASKRGWTTWTVAATDRRVKLAVPLVMSLLHFEEVMQTHYMAMGNAWSFAFKPYWRENLTVHLTDELTEDVLWKYEDPFRYRSRLAGIPKLLVSATGDEFFLCQDHHSWWDDMGGPKWLLMLPNAEHSMAPYWLRIYRTVVGWFNTIIEQGVEAVPEITWEREEFEDGGEITYTSNQQPEVIRGMRAVTLRNSTRRDFRLAGGDFDSIIPQPIVWRESTVSNTSTEDEARFVLTDETVENRWVGFFIEGTYASESGFEMTLTSEVQIVPDTFPGERCEGDACFGSLV